MSLDPFINPIRIPTKSQCLSFSRPNKIFVIPRHFSIHRLLARSLSSRTSSARSARDLWDPPACRSGDLSMSGIPNVFFGAERLISYQTLGEMWLKQLTNHPFGMVY